MKTTLLKRALGVSIATSILFTGCGAEPVNGNNGVETSQHITKTSTNLLGENTVSSLRTVYKTTNAGLTTGDGYYGENQVLNLPEQFESFYISPILIEAGENSYVMVDCYGHTYYSQDGCATWKKGEQLDFSFGYEEDEYEVDFFDYDEVKGQFVIGIDTDVYDDWDYDYDWEDEDWDDEDWDDDGYYEWEYEEEYDWDDDDSFELNANTIYNFIIDYITKYQEDDYDNYDHDEDYDYDEEYDWDEDEYYVWDDEEIDYSQYYEVLMDEDGNLYSEIVYGDYDYDYDDYYDYDYDPCYEIGVFDMNGAIKIQNIDEYKGLEGFSCLMGGFDGKGRFLVDAWEIDGKCFYYDFVKEEKTEITALNENYNVYDLNGNNVLCYDYYDQIWIYNIEEDTWMEDACLTQFDMETDMYFTFDFVDEDTVVAISELGIYVHELGTDTMTLLVDGRTCELGNIEDYIEYMTFEKIDDDSFLIVLDNGSVLKFTYDADMTDPEIIYEL